ncbi:MAG: NAD(P)/FAD-dependent oxidoreductase [Betaproteobacteria bacterium]|nr:NAD(P)/FAD-dependent oxidoreductase [Betaproteobacteria bacterium]
MPAHSNDGIVRRIDGWLKRFNPALENTDAHSLAALFVPDSHWRDVLALTWRIETISGGDEIGRRLKQHAPVCGARNFAIHPDRCPPRVVERAGVRTIEAILAFETDVGRGAGIVRIKCDAVPASTPRAWTLLTALDELKGHEEALIRSRQEGSPYARDFHAPNCLDQRHAAASYADRDPAVLIVGGGHAGLTAAARLGQLGVDTLVIDKEARVGDNWRLRYHGLMLHNQVHSNHLPYMPFPSTWPNYISKDRIANWLETYAECMEIDFWTRTAFESARFDPAARCWSASLRLADGASREIRPRHIVMATSVSGTPNIPDIPTLDRFAGTVIHSSQFKNADPWRDRHVLVLGTGTSAHDIAQDLHGSGARVTMVQRSPTLVVNVEPSAQIYDGIYLGAGPSLEDRDLINASMPLQLTKTSHRLLTDKVKEYDKVLLQGLKKAGFKLDFGEDGTGWPLKYRTRGGGYYFNVGCSELIVNGAIGLIQYQDITEFDAQGARMKDGRNLRADLIVLATGFKGQDHLVDSLFGKDVAKRVGPVWGFDDRTQELRNMWTQTGQPGLWFTAGAFSQCRVYSKVLALQIKAAELGLI